MRWGEVGMVVARLRNWIRSVCVVSVTLAHLVQRHSLRVFVWSSPTEHSRRGPESPRGEYDTSFTFDHFIKFAWKNQLKSRI